MICEECKSCSNYQVCELGCFGASEPCEHAAQNNQDFDEELERFENRKGVEKMKLKEFVEKFICRNTVIRLWKPSENELQVHDMIPGDNSSGVCMEWQLLKGSVPQSKYNDYEVLGITDILTEDYKEAVNIVIKAK